MANDNNIDDIQKGVLHKKKFDIIVHDESPNSLTRDLGNKQHKSVNTKAYRKPMPRPVSQESNNTVPEKNNSQNVKSNATSVNNSVSKTTTPPQNLQYDMPQDFVETNTNYVEDEERKRQREKQLNETLDNYDKLLKEQEEKRKANLNEYENAYNNLKNNNYDVQKHETYLENRAKREEVVANNIEGVKPEEPQQVVEETNYNENNNVSNGQIGYDVDKNKVEYEVNNNNNANPQQTGYEVNKVEESQPVVEEEKKEEQPTPQEENKEEVKEEPAEEESAYSLSAIQQKNMKRRKENIRLVILLIILVTLAILCVVLFILRSRMIDDVPTGITVENQTSDVNREERILFTNVNTNTTTNTTEGTENNTEDNTQNAITNSSLDELLNTENTTSENTTTENTETDNTSFNTHTAEGDSANTERTLEEQLEATQTTLNELRSN